MKEPVYSKGPQSQKAFAPFCGTTSYKVNFNLIFVCERNVSDKRFESCLLGLMNVIVVENRITLSIGSTQVKRRLMRRRKSLSSMMCHLLERQCTLIISIRNQWETKNSKNLLKPRIKRSSSKFWHWINIYLRICWALQSYLSKPFNTLHFYFIFIRNWFIRSPNSAKNIGHQWIQISDTSAKPQTNSTTSSLTQKRSRW